MQILKTIFNKKTSLLLVFATMFCLQTSAVPHATPIAMVGTHAYETSYDARKDVDKETEESKASSSYAGVAFPSKNILLGIVLIGVYVLFVRNNIGSRKTDF